MTISLEQISELAPDEKSVAAAREIALPQSWQHIGVCEFALWGIFGRGSGYQVKIDLENLGAACNCPSRKYPCKHALALLMVFSRSPDAASVETPPDWVTSWIEKRRQRASRASKATQKPHKPVDKKAQTKRSNERMIRVRTGLELLSLWLDDLIRDGVAGLETKPFSFWDQQSRRMVDAQAKGLASRLLTCAATVGSGPNWPTQVAFQLGRLKLLLQAFERIEQFSPDLQSDLRQLIGWNISQSEIDAHNDIVQDDWLVVGQRIEEEERLRIQRSWLVGRNSQSEAQILQFAVGMAPFPESILPGQRFTADLAYFPGRLRQRAKLHSPMLAPIEEFFRPAGCSSIEEFLTGYAKHLASNPWMPNCLCVLDEVTLSPQAEQWFVTDAHGTGLPIVQQGFWNLLAESGGEPFLFFGEWNGSVCTPLGAIIHGNYRKCS